MPVKPICAFPAKSWSKKHVWIGVCFGGMFRDIIRGCFKVCCGVCLVVLGSVKEPDLTYFISMGICLEDSPDSNTKQS